MDANRYMCRLSQIKNRPSKVDTSDLDLIEVIIKADLAGPCNSPAKQIASAGDMPHIQRIVEFLTKDLPKSPPAFSSSCSQPYKLQNHLRIRPAASVPTRCTTTCAFRQAGSTTVSPALTPTSDVYQVCAMDVQDHPNLDYILAIGDTFKSLRTGGYLKHVTGDPCSPLNSSMSEYGLNDVSNLNTAFIGGPLSLEKSGKENDAAAGLTGGGSSDAHCKVGRRKRVYTDIDETTELSDDGLVVLPAFQQLRKSIRSRRVRTKLLFN